MASSDDLLKQAEEQAAQAARHMEKMNEAKLEMERLLMEAGKQKEKEKAGKK